MFIIVALQDRQMVNPSVVGDVAQFLTLYLDRLVLLKIKRLTLRQQRVVLFLLSVRVRLHINDALVTHHISLQDDGRVALVPFVCDQIPTRLDLKIEAGDVVEDRFFRLTFHWRTQVQKHWHEVLFGQKLHIVRQYAVISRIELE